MELLVCVVNREERLDQILAGFVELGVTGATVVSSEGMARLVKGDLPVMSNLQAILAKSRPQNTMIFSVIQTEELAARAIAMVEEKLGGLADPGTGIVFTVPVNRVIGLATAQGEEAQ
jgi:nitrogen regulatory protein P-II 1